jgi:succinyl-diaminopimelate desuccinylase
MTTFDSQTLSDTLRLSCALIARPSVTPKDAGCQELIMAHLAPLGFRDERIDSGGVENLWARRGTQAPLLVFAGHTDVVPTGPLDQWQTPPFVPTIQGDRLCGRGAADMKGSLAAFVVACERFVKMHPEHLGSIGLLVTSDEEGPATDGTVKVVQVLEARNEKIDWCLVGEPSSTARLGDVIKNGRRGSLNARLTVLGKQGHVAYPHLAENPIHLAMPALAELSAIEWDAGNQFFPASSLQITNIHAGAGVTNVIPGAIEILFNFRFSTEQTEHSLQQRVEQVLHRHRLRYQLEWSLSGLPFLTPSGPLVQAARDAIRHHCGIEAELSTSGGTSDGRFIAPTGAQVLELGPINATIHQIDEHVSIADLETLTDIYESILVSLLAR